MYVNPITSVEAWQCPACGQVVLNTTGRTGYRCTADAEPVIMHRIPLEEVDPLDLALFTGALQLLLWAKLWTPAITEYPHTIDRIIDDVARKHSRRTVTEWLVFIESTSEGNA